MTILKTTINAQSDEFKTNATAMQALTSDLKEKVSAIAPGASEIRRMLIGRELFEEST